MKFSKDYQPANRRKPDALTNILKDWLNKPYSNSDTTIGEKIVETLVNEAIGGNLKAIQLIWERVEGKPAQSIDLTQSNNGLPTVIYLPADTGVKPYYDEKDVIDPTETTQ